MTNPFIDSDLYKNMTKRLICFCAFWICILNVGNAQPLGHRDSVRMYYELINKAELSIVNSAYDSALSCYVDARKYKWLNADDLYNAGIVAYLTKDTPMSVYFLNTLATYGLKKADFEERQWGEQVKNERFYQYISKYYDSVYYKSTMDSSMVFYGKKMKPFMDKDQSVRGFIFDEKGIPIAPAPKNKNTENSDHENRVAMLQYVTEFGFPSFKQTGFYDAMKISDASGTYWYLCWHSYADTTLAAVTLNAVLDGDFPPDDYALFFDVKRPFDGEMVYHTTPESSYTEEQIKIIDKERSSIYLDPLEDYVKKLEYYNKDRRFLLLNNFAFGIYKLAKSHLLEESE